MGKPNNNQRRSRRYDPQPGRFYPDDRDLRIYDNQNIPDDTVSLPEREIQDPSAPLGSNQGRDANETQSTFSRPVDSADNSLDSQQEPHEYARLYPNPHVEKGEKPKKSPSKEPPSNDDPHPRPKSPEEILLDDIDTTEKKGRLIKEQLNINAQMQENLQAEAANYEDERNVMKVRENLLQQQEDNLDQVKEVRERLARLQAGEEAAMKNHVTIFEAIRDIKKMIKESNSNTNNVLERVEKLERRKIDDTDFYSPVSNFGSDYQSTPQPSRPGSAPRQRGRRAGRGSPSPSSSSSSSSASSSRSRRDRHSHDRRRRSADRKSDKSHGTKSSGRSRGGRRSQGSRDHGRRSPGDHVRPGGGDPRGPGYDPMRGGQRHSDKRKKKHSNTSGGGSGGDPGGGGGGGNGPPSDDGLSSSSSNSSIDSDLSRRSHLNQNPVSRLIYKLKMILRKMKRAFRRHPNVKILLEQEIQRGSKISLELDDYVARLRHVTTSDLDRIERLGERVDRARVRLTIQVERLELERAEASRGARSVLPQFSGDCTQYTGFEREFRRGVKSYANDDLKITALRKAITGHQKEYIVSLFLHCDNFEMCLKRLSDRFGDYHGLLPSETQKIRDLPVARSPEQENDNILRMRNFISWCILNGRADADFSEMSEIMRTKLLDRSQDMIITNSLCKMSEFETLFAKLNKINQKKIISRNPRAGDVSGSGGTRGTGHSGGGGHQSHSGNGPSSGGTGHRPFTTGSRYSAHTDMVCDICSQPGHSKYQCPKVRNCSNVTEARRIIREAGRCDMCLQKYTPGHYCSDTYFHKKESSDGASNHTQMMI